MYWQSKQFSSPELAVAACPFIENSCSNQREYQFHTNEEETIDLVNLDSHHVCTYKIDASTGAPGFNFYQNFGGQKWEEERIIVSWVEYDLSNVAMTLEYGAWPVPATQIYELKCGSNCAQGALPPRAVVDENGHSMQYDSERLLNDLDEQIHLYNIYNTRVEIIREFNANVPNEDDKLAMPSLPAEYTGYTFEESSNLGGFGHPTSGMYDTHEQDWSGFKPYGAFGQGERDDLSVSLDDNNRARVMLVTINPQASMLETTGDATWFDYDIENYLGAPGWSQTNETVSLKVGQYSFRPTLEFDPPTQEMAVSVDGARTLMALAIAAPVVALSLF